MEIIIILTIIAGTVFSIIGSVKKRAAQNTPPRPTPQTYAEEQVEYTPPVRVDLQRAYTSPFEGQAPAEASVPPMPTVAAAEHSVRVPEAEIPAKSNPLGLFSDQNECVKAVIYSEIMTPKFK